MKKLVLSLVVLVVAMTACVPPTPKANPEETLYEYIPTDVDALFQEVGLPPVPAHTWLLIKLKTHFEDLGSPATGYESLKFQGVEEMASGVLQLSFLSKHLTDNDQIKSVWRVVERGFNFVGVYAKTTSSDANINTAIVEKGAFDFLDGVFRRVR